MLRLPRLAVGALQPQVDIQVITWALLEALELSGVATRLFASQSRFDQIGGLRGRSDERIRHLDGWLMDPATQRHCLLSGHADHELSLVVGYFVATCEPASNGPDSTQRICPVRPSNSQRVSEDDHVGGNVARWRPEVKCPFSRCGTLGPLVESLDLPAVVVLDVSATPPCGLPAIPPGVRGVLLVGCQSNHDIARWQTWIEAAHGVEVWGGLSGSLARLASGSRYLGAAKHALISQLGSNLLRTLRVDRLMLAAREAPAWTDATLEMDDAGATPCDASHLVPRDRRRIRVAVAYDELFYEYFPDTLDWLESQGAVLQDFSPLRSCAIPRDTDLVWIGCGHPERDAERLARNSCLHHSLRTHVQQGGRLYAEGGGLAYACRQMNFQGRSIPMAGIFPAEANLIHPEPSAVSMRLSRRTWLGDWPLRGYLNPLWSFTPDHERIDLTAHTPWPGSVVRNHRALGSRLHLHFAAQPKLLRSLLCPHSA